MINMENKTEQHDANGINEHCIAFWEECNGSCSILRGPRVCPSHGDANRCVLNHPELYLEYYRRKIKQGLMRIIKENLRNPSMLDLNKISSEIMEKYYVRLKNNTEE